MTFAIGSRNTFASIQKNSFTPRKRKRREAKNASRLKSESSGLKTSADYFAALFATAAWAAASRAIGTRYGEQLT